MRVANMRTLMAALGLLTALLLPSSASAGVATAGAVLLDPFDPVPEIQFRHFGGYGCDEGCGGYNRCDDGCGGYRHHRHERCADTCYRRTGCDDSCNHRDRCGDDRCGDRADNDPHGTAAPPCTSSHCYDSEHYEHRWRDGDRVGFDWSDRGHKERVIPTGEPPHSFYGNDHDDDDNGPPPAGH